MLFSLFKSFASQVERAKNTPGARIIDVRTEEEFAAGHLPQAENVPLDRLSGARFNEGEKLFVYCHSGARSGRAAAYLKKAGADAVDMGGIAGYKGEIVGGR